VTLETLILLLDLDCADRRDPSRRVLQGHGQRRSGADDADDQRLDPPAAATTTA
jgi:hypothetical protein